MCQSLTIPLMGLLLLASIGCQSKSVPETWVLMTVRDSLDRQPVANPQLIVGNRSAFAADAEDAKSFQGNEHGTARVPLISRGVKQRVVIDAKGYDLHTVDLPSMNAFFPAGRWLPGEVRRAYPLRPDNRLELLISVEPTRGE
jgi:hypothetical protein